MTARWMRARTSSRSPSSWAALAATPGCGVWAVCHADRSGAGLGRRRRMVGAGAAALWTALEHLVGRGRQTVVMAHGMLDTLAAAGLHDVLADDDWWIDSRAPGGLSQRRGRGPTPSGYPLVMGACPCIIPLRRRTTSGRLIMIDSRNMAIAPADGAAEPAVVVDGLMDTLTAIDLVVRSRQWGPLALTCGGQASAVWRCLHYNDAVWCHDHGGVAAMERAALYGGRCEAYIVGAATCTVYHMDIRSCYPHLCTVTPVPCRLCWYREQPDIVQALMWIVEYGCIADVTLETTGRDYPHRGDGGITYPRGSHRATLATAELRRAASRLEIRTVHAIAVYEEALALAAAATDLLDAQQTAPGADRPDVRRWLKSCAVSLHSRTAMRLPTWEPAPDGDAPAPMAEWWHPLADGRTVRRRSVGWRVEQECDRVETDNAACGIAAAIESAGRVRLLALLEAAGAPHVHYCDTDALVTDYHGMRRLQARGLLDSDGPGQLRTIGVYTDWICWGARHYCANGVVHRSGVPQQAFGGATLTPPTTPVE